jgi:type VI secretion system ImpM family protein
VFGWGKKAFKPSVFALGKVPGHPEFLAAPDALASTIDRWLDAGWQAAHGRPGDAWEEAFVAGSPYGFLWGHGSKVGQVTCGVLCPSADSIGRHYPLVVASRMEAARLERSWPLVPVAATRFLDEAHGLMTEAHAASITSSELAQRLAHLPLPGASDVDVAESDQGAWNDDTGFEDGWRAVFADDTAASATHALEGLVEALRPWVRREWPAASLVLRCPLGDGGPAAAVQWLEAVQAVLHWRQTIPTAFWAAGGADLFVSLGPADPSLLRDLWAKPAEAGHLVDVVGPGTTEAASPSLEGLDGASMAACLKALRRASG